MAPNKVSTDSSQVEEKILPKSTSHQFIKNAMDYTLANFSKKSNLVKGVPSIQQRIALGVEFLELEYTAKYGFLTWVSKQEDMRNPKISCPNIFDTVVMIDTLAANGVLLSPVILRSIKEKIDEMKLKDSIWVFFYRRFNYIPDDVDTTSNILALANRCLDYTPEEISTYVNQMLDVCTIYEDNLPDVYVRYKTPIDTGFPPIDVLPVKRRVDLVIVSTFLYGLIQTGVDHLPKFENCYKLLDDALTAMLSKDGNGFMVKFAKNYTNWDICLFFISRLLPKSQYAQEMLGEKIIRLLELRCARTEKDDALSLACRILTASHVGLLRETKGHQMISQNLQRLMVLQDNETFLFPMESFYNAHYLYYFGSQAFTTSFAIAALAAVKNSEI